MEPVTLTCPQCGSPLPRRALWRTVTCVFCAADVTRSEDVVPVARFHEAYARMRAHGAGAIACAGHHYRAIAHLGSGPTARLVLADRVGAIGARVVLKIAHANAPAGRLQREKEVLDTLQADPAPPAIYFSQRLPQAIALGRAELAPGERREILVLRHSSGYWGSLADVKRHHPLGIDARHAVWMWRRVLEVLGHVHASGWVHGNLVPQHLLVHPGDHGIRIIGWAGARTATAHLKARDLMQSAWALRAMLSDTDTEPAIMSSTPRPLAALLRRASEDAAWCAASGAQGLNDALSAARREAFGPSRFIHFSPTASN